ncbi:MAG: hypothetical protein EKK63_01690 [Acinetobacter sp.]|uniref:hypothetical protein n=1 Tax=Acinetobacter sp. TaxID=472 RepID=UPI000FB8D0F1|nr:hypothetical protein [Acinetobacter sp.]RUP42317.1 MAG: hypothetical protein EKK63_01690 [Acinetobacter sp.]
MKIVDTKDILLSDCKTVSEYVDELKKRTGRDTITPSTIFYQLKETDNLDWLEHSGVTLILMNEKAKNFIPGTTYGKQRLRKDTYQHL